MNILVSVVITTYKRPIEVLMRAVRSVLKQTYRKLEIVIVDDSPKGWENSKLVEKALLELESENIKYHKNPQNVGACVSRNIGIDISNGEYIAFLDDDDEWEPTKIEKQLGLVGQYDLVYCLATAVYEDGTREPFSNVHANGDLYDRLLYENIVGSTSLAMVSRRALNSVGGFDPEMESSQDYDLWLRLSKQYKVGCVNESLAIYHVHSGERITTNPAKKIQGSNRIIQKNFEAYKKCKKAWSKQLSKIVYYYVMQGDLKSAKKTAFQAMRLYPGLLNEHLHSIYWIIKSRGITNES